VRKSWRTTLLEKSRTETSEKRVWPREEGKKGMQGGGKPVKTQKKRGRELNNISAQRSGNKTRKERSW